MKKFLIFILFLIPIVILLAVSATGEIIKAIRIVEVREIIILNEKDELLDLNRTYQLDLVGQDSLKIMVNVLPAITYDKTVLFAVVEGEEYEGEVRVDKIEGTSNQYYIYPTKAGACKLKIYARNNIEAVKYIDFFITTNRLERIEVSFNNQTLENGATLTIEDGIRLNFRAHPINAMGANLISWTSEDKNVLEIDNNGSITINSRGITKVTVMVNDKSGLLHNGYIFVDTNEALVKTRKVYHINPINVEWIRSNIILDQSLNVVKEGDSSFHVSNGKKTVLVESFIVQDGQWDIINRDIFSYDELGRARVYIDNGGYTIKVDYLDFLNENIINSAFKSSNNSIAEITSEGTIIPKVYGEEFTITVFADGKTLEMNFIVKSRANAFSLNLSQVDNLRGIKQERVWAINWYTNEQNIMGQYKFNITQTFYLGYNPLSVIFAGINTDIDLKWKVNNTDWANVDENGNVTFKHEACGNTVNVTAMEVIEKGFITGLSRTYSFKIVDDKYAMNVIDIQEASRAAEGINNNYIDGDERAIVLQNDLFERSDYNNYSIPYNDKTYEYESLSGGRRTGDNHWNSRYYDKLEPVKNIYGNGFKIKGEGASDSIIDISLRSLVNNNSEPLLIENLELIAGYKNDPAGFNNYLNDNTDDEKKDLKFSAIRLRDYRYIASSLLNSLSIIEENFTQLTDEEIISTRVDLKYCYINTAYEGISIFETGQLNIEGSIISNVLVGGISIDCSIPDLANITLNRLVIRDSEAIGIVGFTENINNAANYMPSITIKGFYDSYVWIETKDFKILGEILDLENAKKEMPQLAGLITTLNQNFDRALEESFKKKGLPITYKGKDYCNFALFTFGLWADVDFNRVKDVTNTFKRETFVIGRDERILEIFTIGMIADILSITMNEGKPVNLTKPNYYLTYEFKDGEAPIMPDSRIPSNQMLYNRLQGN